MKSGLAIGGSKKMFFHGKPLMDFTFKGKSLKLQRF
jgi:hypothetical protein